MRKTFKTKLLRPKHLIYGRSLTSVNKNNLVEINENEMRKLKIFTANRLKQFMGIFNHGYLLALQQHHSYDRKVKSSDRYLKIGDVVIVKDVKLPRLSWRKGRVIGLHSGHDDVIRSASVKVYQRNTDKTFILKQPSQHLVLLETTIKDPTNESQCCGREAAMNADTIRKLTT